MEIFTIFQTSCLLDQTIDWHMSLANSTTDSHWLESGQCQVRTRWEVLWYNFKQYAQMPEKDSLTKSHISGIQGQKLLFRKRASEFLFLQLFLDLLPEDPSLRFSIYLNIPGFPVGKPSQKSGFLSPFWVSRTSGNPVISTKIQALPEVYDCIYARG